MLVAILKERRPHEKRVAATPETVKKLKALGFELRIEKGAGVPASFPDQAYVDAGATIAADARTAIDGADLILKVQRPLTASEGNDEMAGAKRGAMLVGLLAPYAAATQLQEYAAAGLHAMSLELTPRTTRAQAMDVLSSQANLAGYKAVLEAANHFTRGFPMMMTAAGTVPPARVFVMGAGVAGLQAIATARRLGAIVCATDVRPVAKEQVESLGGTFVMVESEETKQAQTSGGYAKEMSEDYKRQQAELVAETLKKQDIVICTALIPGKPAPKLISEEMLKSMKPGSVVIDLAVEQGGNCFGNKPGEVVEVGGVTIVGHLNVPSRIAADASSLYARNLLNFLTMFWNKETKTLKLEAADDIVKAITLTRDGAVVHPSFGGPSAQAA